MSTLSFSTALFVFQACYGTNKDFGIDTVIKGCVKSKSDNKPIAEIKVSFANLPQHTFTDKNGEFQMYCSINNTYIIQIEDSNNAKTTPSETKIVVGKKPPFLTFLIDT